MGLIPEPMILMGKMTIFRVNDSPSIGGLSAITNVRLGEVG